MKLIIKGALAERNWIEWIFSDLVTDVMIVDHYRPVDGPVILVVDSNNLPLSHADDLFSQFRHSDDLTLFHCSDEFLSGGYQSYRHFDRVIRIYHSWLADAPGILTVPLGWPAGGMGPDIKKPAKERAFLWSFAGEIKASRIEMVRALSGVTPSVMHDTLFAPKLQKRDYIDLMSDTLFLPCPMGNVLTETWRLYEALEYGCIPIIETRPFIDYYRNLFGDNPIIKVNDWKEAGSVIKRLSSDGDALSTMQNDLMTWWSTKKIDIRRSVAAFMQEKHGEDLNRFAGNLRNRDPLLFQPYRTAEILRHQTLRSTIRKLRRMIKRQI